MEYIEFSMCLRIAPFVKLVCVQASVAEELRIT